MKLRDREIGNKMVVTGMLMGVDCRCGMRVRPSECE